MKIVVDAMGGDHAPSEVVKGAVDAVREYGVEVLLVGQTPAVEAAMPLVRPHGITIVHASEVIAMGDSPARVVRDRKDSSIAVGMRLVKEGQAQGFVSAGHSGAVMASALLLLGCRQGIDRPALAAVFPFPKGPVLCLDVGANADCKPEWLAQFGQMGADHMSRVIGIANPRVGLLSNGEEEGKGNRLVREAFPLLKQSGLNFVGNVEGKDIPRNLSDVVVTDGFTGNVLLKTAEAVAEVLFGSLRQVVEDGWPHIKVAASVLKPHLEGAAKLLDYSEYGGAMLLGAKGNVIIAHGRSRARAVKSAIRAAMEAAERGVPVV